MQSILWEPTLALCIDAKDCDAIKTEIYRPERHIVLDALCRLDTMAPDVLAPDVLAPDVLAPALLAASPADPLGASLDLAGG